MAEVKAIFAKASITNRERVVFDVLGGNYRLVVAIKFSAKIVFINSSARMPSTTGSTPRSYMWHLDFSPCRLARCVSQR